MFTFTHWKIHRYCEMNKTNNWVINNTGGTQNLKYLINGKWTHWTT